ncbi:type II CAAX endopeptidase family protein [soil metagenome]
MLDRVTRAAAHPPGSTSPIPLPTAFGGYVLAWFAGQLLAAFVLMGSDSGDDRSIPILFSAVALTWIAYLGMLWWLSIFAGTGAPAKDYAARFRPVDLVGIPLGVVTQLVLVPLLYWPLREIWPDTFSLDDVAEYAEDLVDGANGAEIVLLVVMVAVLAPVVEELVYRGLLHRSIAARVPPALAILASAAFFMLIHFRPIEYPGLFLVGIVLATCVAATGRIGMAVAAHIAFNATGLLVVAG